MMSLSAQQPIQSDDQRDPRVQGMRLLGTPSKTATAPVALSSITARIAGRTRYLTRSHVVIPRRKKRKFSGPIANAGQNGQSAGYLASVAVALNRWLKKRDENPAQ